jgi:rhamnogalacturonyl hydrolase YesR
MVHVSNERHVDFSIFGVIPLEIYRLKGDTALRARGLEFADRQWSDANAAGISNEARRWADDLFMLPILQLQAFRATGDRRYLTQLLTSLPENHADRPRILAGYRTMMATLLANQTPHGLWRQLVDKPEVWEESSGSAMFAYAMIAGVRRGWLDNTRYGPAARRAWIALVAELDENANLRDICIGTGRGVDVVGRDLDAQYRYYVARPRTTGDLHGQAPMLWAAAALLSAP